MDNLNKIKNLTVPIQKEMAEFEEKLEDTINSEPNFLTQKLYSFIFNNPKRLRPIFVFLFSKILEISSQKVMNIALVSELIHNASLIHDDILDNENIRRNQKTFHYEYSNKIAILEGDLLLAMSLKILSDTSSEISNIFSIKILDTIQGELTQFENQNKYTDLDIYFKKTFDKTGNIFMAGLESLYTLKEINNQIKDDLKNYLYDFCLAFQIKNDLFDYEHNLQDYKNGNYTLPVLYFNTELESKSDTEKKELAINKAKLYIENLNIKSQTYLKNIDNPNKKYLIDLNNLILGSN